MSTTIATTRDRGDRYGPIEWAQKTCKTDRLNPTGQQGLRKTLTAALNGVRDPFLLPRFIKYPASMLAQLKHCCEPCLQHEFTLCFPLQKYHDLTKYKTVIPEKERKSCFNPI